LQKSPPRTPQVVDFMEPTTQQREQIGPRTAELGDPTRGLLAESRMRLPPIGSLADVGLKLRALPSQVGHFGSNPLRS
jgi:hypothetical protein